MRRKLRLSGEIIRTIASRDLVVVRGGQPIFTEDEMSCDSRAKGCTATEPWHSLGGTCYVQGGCSG